MRTSVTTVLFFVGGLPVSVPFWWPGRHYVLVFTCRLAVRLDRLRFSVSRWIPSAPAPRSRAWWHVGGSGAPLRFAALVEWSGGRGRPRGWVHSPRPARGIFGWGRFSD